MTESFEHEDLRIIKTRRALFSGLLYLLGQKKFSEITVYAICTESLVSRTAFYAHFRDKYDLLDFWLKELQNRFLSRLRMSRDLRAENLLYEVYAAYPTVVFNLLKDSDSEQQHSILRFLSGAVSSTGVKALTEDQTLASDFLAGGLLNVLSSQIKTPKATSTERVKNSITFLCKISNEIIGRDIRPPSQKAASTHP